MKVKKLIEILSKVDQNRIVVVSRDAEGNSFSPFCDYSLGAYVKDSAWSGEVGLESLTEENRIAGYTEEDVKKGKPCIVLWPTN